MPVHPKPPPPPGNKTATLDYIKDVVEGDYSEDVKIKFIEKAVK